MERGFLFPWVRCWPTGKILGRGTTCYICRYPKTGRQEQRQTMCLYTTFASLDTVSPSMDSTPSVKPRNIHSLHWGWGVLNEGRPVDKLRLTDEVNNLQPRRYRIYICKHQRCVKLYLPYLVLLHLCQCQSILSPPPRSGKCSHMN
jgi:hypothetical protein